NVEDSYRAVPRIGGIRAAHGGPPRPPLGAHRALRGGGRIHPRDPEAPRPVDPAPTRLPHPGGAPGAVRGGGDPAEGGEQLSRTFSSLSFYNYRMWFIGALIANIGTWMQRIAQDWLVLTELTDNSGFAVGIVTALQFIPTVFLTPVAGVLTDRFNRRKILLTTQTALGVLAAGLGAMVLTGVAQLWHVYVFALLLGVVSALDAPARQVFVSELVPANQLANAVGLNSASFNAARLIGPGIAGLGIAAVGTGWIFIINALSFAATIAAVLAMRVADLRTP